MFLVQWLFGCPRAKYKFLLTPFLSPLLSCAWTLVLGTLQKPGQMVCSWEDARF